MREHLEDLLFHCSEQRKILETEHSRVSDEIRRCENLLSLSRPLSQPEAVLDLGMRGLGNLSPTWIAILRRLACFEHFGANDVILVSRELNKEQPAVKVQTYGNARFQLATYAKKRLIERRGGGNYRLSEKSKVLLTLITEAQSHQHITKVGNDFGPELAALTQERRVTPANHRPRRAQQERR